MNEKIKLYIKKVLRKTTEFSNLSISEDVRLLTQGGSDRKFYRISKIGQSVVLMQSLPTDPDFEHFIEIAQYLHRKSIPVPELYFIDRKNRIVIMEDLGDHTLQQMIVNEPDENIIFYYYKMALDTLVNLQMNGSKEMDSCSAIKNRVFNYDALRWETEYFKKYFLKRYCRMKIIQPQKLQDEFHQLAMKLIAEPKYLMHRDFQSQNILIKNDKIRILDFQGARQGLLAYDLVSLLKDAYVELSTKLRNELLYYYLYTLRTNWRLDLDSGYFYQIFRLTGLQRNMQALGAFSYLSLIKGKHQFQQYIPTAIKYLQLALSESNDFPVLTNLVNSL